MNDCITTTKQSTTKPCAYVLVYTVLFPAHITSHHTTPHRIISNHTSHLITSHFSTDSRTAANYLITVTGAKIMHRFLHEGYQSLQWLLCVKNIFRSWTLWGRDKMAIIFRTACPIAFLWMKIMNSGYNFTEVVPYCPFNNMPGVVQIMASRRSGRKP